MTRPFRHLSLSGLSETSELVLLLPYLVDYFPHKLKAAYSPHWKSKAAMQRGPPHFHPIQQRTVLPLKINNVLSKSQSAPFSIFNEISPYLA